MMSRTVTITAEPVARFSGPPADRMAGRATARAARAAAAKPQGNYRPKDHSTTREQLLDEAVHAGVIDHGMRAHYAACYDADPSGTRSYLNALGLARMHSQSTPPPAQAEPDAYSQTGLSTAERGRISAAREGRGPARIVNGGL
jgi:hypothetical protein